MALNIVQTGPISRRWTETPANQLTALWYTQHRVQKHRATHFCWSLSESLTCWQSYGEGQFAPGRDPQWASEGETVAQDVEEGHSYWPHRSWTRMVALSAEPLRWSVLNRSWETQGDTNTRSKHSSTHKFPLVDHQKLTNIHRVFPSATQTHLRSICRPSAWADLHSRSPAAWCPGTLWRSAGSLAWRPGAGLRGSRSVSEPRSAAPALSWPDPHPDSRSPHRSSGGLGRDPDAPGSGCSVWDGQTSLAAAGRWGRQELNWRGSSVPPPAAADPDLPAGQTIGFRTQWNIKHNNRFTLNSQLSVSSVSAL